MQHARRIQLQRVPGGTNFKATSIALPLKYIGGIFMHNTRYIINGACMCMCECILKMVPSLERRKVLRTN